MYMQFTFMEHRSRVDLFFIIGDKRFEKNCNLEILRANSKNFETLYCKLGAKLIKNERMENFYSSILYCNVI